MRRPTSSLAPLYSALRIPRASGGVSSSRRATAVATRSLGAYSFDKNRRLPSLAPARNFGLYQQESFLHYQSISTSKLPLPRLFPTSVRYLSNSNEKKLSNKEKNDTNNQIKQKGEDSYKLAMEALEKASSAKQKHEAKLVQEQFDAMDKQRKRTQQREQERQNKKNNDPRLEKLNAKMNAKGDSAAKDRAAGVAVVRTIVKQSRSVLVDKWDNNSNNNTPSKKANDSNDNIQKLSDEEHYQKIAQMHMKEAAFRYGHPLALVRLGNEALELAKEEDTTDSSSSSISSFIDREKCEEWMDDSPINLATLIELDNHLQLAIHLYKEAGKRGSAEGWYNLGHLLWDGPASQHQNDGNATKETAMDAFQEAIELGDADAMYFVAAQYLSFEEDGSNASLLSTTYKRHGPAFISLLQSGNLDSLPTMDQAELSYFTNELHQNGYILLHSAAHAHNHGPALHHLALLHNQHDNVDGFKQLLSKAAATHNPDSLFLQGHCYYFGTDGYDQNFQLAFENFVEAADNGHVDAMVSAGAMLHQGVMSPDGRTAIVEKDQQRAFELYQQAGELGSMEGWRNVVSCYATGEGVPKCLDTAKYMANTMLKEDNN